MRATTLNQKQLAGHKPPKVNPSLEMSNSSPLLTKITNRKSLKNLGILCMVSKDIQAITKNSGTHAVTSKNEYQVHYWFLNGRFTLSDGSIIDLAIPTIYFNYKQEVSGGHVDFELSDVDDVSEAVLPLHNATVNDLLSNSIFNDHISKLKIKILGKFGPAEFQWINVNLGTIHKHPGNMDSFSGTDLSTKTTSPGICFPFGPLTEEDVDNKPSFSSIMLHKNGSTSIGHTEYRTATMPVDGELVYDKHRAVTLVSAKSSPISSVEKFLGVKPAVYSYLRADSVTEDQLELLDIHENVFDILEDINYSASTKFIDPNNVNVSVNTYFGGFPSSTKSTKHAITTPHRNSTEWKRVHVMVTDMYDIDLFPYSVLVQMSGPKKDEYYKELFAAFYNKTPDTKSILILPTDIIALQDKIWLEVQHDDADIEIDATKNSKNTLTFQEDLLDDWNQMMGLSLDVSSEDMGKDLISWGVDKLLIATSSNDKIKTMWEHVMNEIGEE